MFGESIKGFIMEVSPAKKLKVNDSGEEDGTVDQYGNWEPQGILMSPATIHKLHPEVWARCFELMSPKDFLSVINACPEFRNIAGPLRVMKLFPLVCPFLLPEFSRKTILDLRLVSGSIKTEVDKTLQRDIASPDACFDEYYASEMSDNYEYYSEIDNIKHKFNFSSRQTVENFLKIANLEQDNKNVFLTRAVSLICKTRGEYEENLDFMSFNGLLLKHGHHLSSLNIVFEDGLSYRNQVVSKISSLLAHVPQLKVFSAVFPETASQRGDILPALPKLENLVGLNFNDMVLRNIALPILHQYGRQLTTLQCPGSVIATRGLTADAFTSLLPNLRKLSLASIGAAGLKKLSKVGWQLEHLRFTEFSVLVIPNLQDVIKAICAHHKTLAVLEILDSVEGSNVRMQDLVSRCMFRSSSTIFPKLQTIYKFADNTCSEDWVWVLGSKCPSLKEFHITTNDQTIIQRQNNVKWARSGLKRMPQLEKIVIWHEMDNLIYNSPEEIPRHKEKQIIRRK